MDKLHLHEFLVTAWRATLSRTLPWIFGAIIAVVTLFQERLTEHWPEATSWDDLMTMLSDTSIADWQTTGVFLFSLFILSTFGRSNLIASLAFVAGKNNLESSPRSLPALLKNFSCVFAIECLVFLFLLVIISILSLPLLIAVRNNSGVMSTLLTLCLITLIPIAASVFIMRQYALYYLLFSSLSIRSAIETSCTLFSRFIFPSFLFGLFSLVLTALFTFSLNFLTVGMARLATSFFSDTTLDDPLRVIQNAPFFYVFTGIFIAWFAIFYQALWIAFFRSIAGNHAKETTPEAESVLSDNLPEIPPAS